MCPENLEINITSDFFLIDPFYDEEDIIKHLFDWYPIFLSVFDHFLGLVLKGLKTFLQKPSMDVF